MRERERRVQFQEEESPPIPRYPVPPCRHRTPDFNAQFSKVRSMFHPNPPCPCFENVITPHPMGKGTGEVTSGDWNGQVISSSAACCMHCPCKCYAETNGKRGVCVGGGKEMERRRREGKRSAFYNSRTYFV